MLLYHSSFRYSYLFFEAYIDIRGLFRIDQSEQEENLPYAFLRGLQTARLSGRAEIVYDSSPQSSEMAGENTSGDLVFYLDGAHSPESMEACAKWFSSAVKEVPNQSFSSKLQNSNQVWGNGNVQPGKIESEKTSKKVIFCDDSCTDYERFPSSLICNISIADSFV